MGAVESGDVSDRRAAFKDVVRTVITRHAPVVVGDESVSRADLDLLAAFLPGVPALDLKAFLSLFNRLLRKFVAAHSQACADDDFAGTVARQYDAIAFRVTPPCRRAALRVYREALGRGPAVVRRLSWPRVATTLAFGPRGRDRLRRLRTAHLP
jgi:hypothetical protein